MGTPRYHRKLALTGWLLALVFMGCAKPEPPKPPLLKTMVVLPFDSESNNVDAPDIMQKLVYGALAPSAYQVRDISETNQFLNEKGIVDGGQLAAVDPIKLGKDLGVQGLLFGYVEDFSYTNIGFYMSRKVSLSLRLVEVNTGQTLWENKASVANRKLTLDKEEAGRMFSEGYLKKSVEKMFKTPLEEEAKQATTQVLRTLPGYYFSGFLIEGKKISMPRAISP